MTKNENSRRIFELCFSGETFRATIIKIQKRGATSVPLALLVVPQKAKRPKGTTATLWHGEHKERVEYKEALRKEFPNEIVSLRKILGAQAAKAATEPSAAMTTTVTEAPVAIEETVVTATTAAA